MEKPFSASEARSRHHVKLRVQKGAEEPLADLYNEIRKLSASNKRVCRDWYLVTHSFDFFYEVLQYMRDELVKQGYDVRITQILGGLLLIQVRW